jgi:succinate dehydrogenase / fumarate reductase, flavoprotein subunit
MQGLADGYFIIPSTVGDYLAQVGADPGLSTDHESFRDAETAVVEKTRRLLENKGDTSAEVFWRELGSIVWDNCGMARSEASLKQALEQIPQLRERFWKGVRVPGTGPSLNQSLEVAGRVADYMEFAELLCLDALERDESAGGHYRIEHTTEEGEAKRDDEHFAHVAVWEYAGANAKPIRHTEQLDFEYVKPSARSYK